MIPPKKKRKQANSTGKKTGKKRKIDASDKNDAMENVTTASISATVTNLEPTIMKQTEQHVIPEKPLNIMEISPFENKLTYKCQSCSKRTNDLDKIETHLKLEHPTRVLDNAGYKIMTRDQIIDMLTMNLTSTNEGGFICYFCEDVVGNIHEIKNHFAAEHGSEIFKVKRVQDGKKPITGYLECQLCGYLSPGLDRSKQRVHFHDEHPLEQSVNCSKYVSKVKNQQNQHKVETFDPLKYIGMSIKCPKENCTFETDSNPAMNAHFRKHTQTFKCGHCGKTHPNSSEFHRHSAMLHGDK